MDDDDTEYYQSEGTIEYLDEDDDEYDMESDQLDSWRVEKLFFLPKRIALEMAAESKTDSINIFLPYSHSNSTKILFFRKLHRTTWFCVTTAGGSTRTGYFYFCICNAFAFRIFAKDWPLCLISHFSLKCQVVWSDRSACPSWPKDPCQRQRSTSLWTQGLKGSLQAGLRIFLASP